MLVASDWSDHPAPREDQFAGFTNRPTRPAEPFPRDVPPCGASLARNSSRVIPYADRASLRLPEKVEPRIARLFGIRVADNALLGRLPDQAAIAAGSARAKPRR